MSNLSNILKQHEGEMMRLVFSSDNDRLKSELDYQNKYASSMGMHTQDVGRAIHRYLEHYINEGFVQTYQEIVKRLKAQNENISNKDLTYEANRLLVDENLTFKASNFSIPKANLIVQVLGKENSTVFYTQEIAVSDEIVTQWSLYNKHEAVGGIGASFHLDGFNELNQVNNMVRKHNESIETLRRCDPNDPREKQLVVEFCEGRPSDGIPEGAVFNRRLLQNIEALQKESLSVDGYNKLYIGIKYVDSDDILQLDRVDLGYDDSLEELYDMLNHYKNKFQNTQPFDR